MRRLTLPLALLAVLALAGLAVAATNASKFDLGFTHQEAGRSPPASRSTSAFANTGGNPVPAALNKFTISLPKGSKFNGAGAPQCKATDKELNEKQSAACPANTFIGSGKATAVPAGGGDTISTTVKIANGKSGRFEFFIAVGGKDVTGFRATTKRREAHVAGADRHPARRRDRDLAQGLDQEEELQGQEPDHHARVLPQEQEVEVLGQLQVRRRHAQADRHRAACSS